MCVTGILLTDVLLFNIKVVHMLLKLLEDKNGEVQNLTVKW